jgi:hypothetical protein
MTQVSTFTTPILFDKVAQELNTALGSMFDDQFPVCSVGIEAEETFPEVYKNDGSKISYRVMPDTARSLSFFTVEGEMTELEEFYFAIPMALTVWVNLKEHNISKAYDYTAELIKDVYNKLRAYGCYDVTINVNDPFEGFSMLQLNVAANTMRPYSAFKISFVKNINVCTV